MPRVVLLGLDGVPPSVISPGLTPTLWGFDRAPNGGLSELPSSTYPGFGSLLTGATPGTHGVRVTTSPGERLPAWAGRGTVGTPTLFDRCAAAGVRTAALCDFDLQVVLRAHTADECWPTTPGGDPPGAAGEYPPTPVVRDHAIDVIVGGSADFVWAHFNRADGFGHELGPEHAETLTCYRELDAAAGAIADALRPYWSDTVLIVVSDHGMAPRAGARRAVVNLDGEAGAVLEAVHYDGAGAMAKPRPGVPESAIRRVLESLEGFGSVHFAPDLVVMSAAPGWYFEDDPSSPGGFHGGEATRATVAAVSGGHPAVPRIAAAIVGQPPRLADWAPTIGTVLGLDSTGMDGTTLA